MELNNTQRSNRVQWVKDLLSGEFKQGHQSLKVPVGDGTFTYCCLGVACERLDPTSSRLEIDDFTERASGYMTDDQADRLLGLSSADQSRAGWWNDGRGYTFARIADFVAYSTQNYLRLDEVNDSDVSEGYAVEWLKQFD